MKKTVLIILWFLLFFSLQITYTVTPPDNVEIQIRFHNEKIYFQTNNIYIDIKISNSGTEPYIFMLADDRFYNFDLELVNLNNVKLKRIESYIIALNKIQPVLHRKQTLNPGESFSVTANLKDYYPLDKTGQFILYARFYPELKLTKYSESFESKNKLALNIKPAVYSEEEQIVLQEKLEREKRILAEKIPPDETIAYMLDARMNEEWDKFFLYIDFHQFILTNLRYRELYNKSSEEEREKLIENYKELLKNKEIDEIAVVPHEYKIVHTEYTPTEATVEVIESFKYLEYIERKLYTYYLHRIGDKWFIYDYKILNMKD